MEYNSKLLFIRYTENEADGWERLLAALKEKFGEVCLKAMVAPENPSNDHELFGFLINKFGEEGVKVLIG